MIDVVLSYHTNPLTCGVAKANQKLAEILGVRIFPLTAFIAGTALVSIKPSEMPHEPTIHAEAYDLWLHGPVPETWTTLVPSARRVFHAEQTGCPATIQGIATRGTFQILLFGMSHKIEAHPIYVHRLCDLLRRTSTDFTVAVSSAVHEGHPWDGAYTSLVKSLRQVFGGRVRMLGYLADDALARELQTATAAALFFDPAARANNTSLWGAMAAGCPVITNLDGHSPDELQHAYTVFDIMQMQHWPFPHLLKEVGRDGQVVAQHRTWEQLADIFRA